MPGSLSHLARRFFDVLLARPLVGSEKAAVGAWLREEEGIVFFSQPPADQRHGYHAAVRVIATGVDDISAIRAALLHDVGKRHSGLGILGRTLASIMIGMRMPLPRSMRIYRDHGDMAAIELAAIGCETIVVEFARNHHDKRPSSIDPRLWAILQEADQPPKAKSLIRLRIS